MNGKIALVTGGSSGIGRATAIAFAKKGAKVVVADITVEGGHETVALIEQNGGNTTFIKADVSNDNDVKNLVDKTVEKYGALDYAFNNAGIESGIVPTHETTLDVWNRIIAVNLTGVFLCMKHEIAYMLENGGGAIVNTSSIAGLVGTPGYSAYVASKHGVSGLTKTAALDYAESNIRVNSVHPGAILTPMVENLLKEHPELEAQVNGMSPMNRAGVPEEIADVVVWLCSEEASYVNGHQMAIDGGLVTR